MRLCIVKGITSIRVVACLNLLAGMCSRTMPSFSGVWQSGRCYPSTSCGISITSTTLSTASYDKTFYIVLLSLQRTPWSWKLYFSLNATGQFFIRTSTESSNKLYSTK